MYSTIAGAPALCQEGMAVSLDTQARQNSHTRKPFQNPIAGISRCYEVKKKYGNR